MQWLRRGGGDISSDLDARVATSRSESGTLTVLIGRQKTWSGGDIIDAIDGRTVEVNMEIRMNLHM